MGSYIPNTRAEREEMLRDAGYGSFAELYADVPSQVLLPDGVDLPAGRSTPSGSRTWDGTSA